MRFPYLPTDNAKTTILIRLIVGAVFLSEGIQKFLFPALRGAGRFEKIGFPEPDALGTLVASFEVLCGMLVLAGLLTRLAALRSSPSCWLLLLPRSRKCMPKKASGSCFMAAGPIGPCFWGVYS